MFDLERWKRNVCRDNNLNPEMVRIADNNKAKTAGRKERSNKKMVLIKLNCRNGDLHIGESKILVETGKQVF